MTFHVLYNDCHLEADTERERQRGEGKGTKRRGRNREGGEFGGLEWLRSPLILASIN